MTKSLIMRAVLATAVVGSMALSVDSAHAVKPTVCPDGTISGDVGRPCAKIKSKRLPGTQQSQAPKPNDSAKKWRDYINGNPKPPINPKR